VPARAPFGHGVAEEPAAVNDAPQVDAEDPAPARLGVVIEERTDDREPALFSAMSGTPFSVMIFRAKSAI